MRLTTHSVNSKRLGRCMEHERAKKKAKEKPEEPPSLFSEVSRL